MNFISDNNPFTLVNIEHHDSLLTVCLGDTELTYTYTGFVRLYNDSNGVGQTWVDYEETLKFEFVPFFSDVPENPLVGSILNWLKEFVAEAEWQEHESRAADYIPEPDYDYCYF